MKILVINCGSSSLKYQFIDMETEEVISKGLCERIGINGSLLTHKAVGKDDFVLEHEMPNHTVAVKLVMDALTDKDHGVISERYLQLVTECFTQVLSIVILLL